MILLLALASLLAAALTGCHRGPQPLGSGRVPADGDPAAIARGEQTLLGRTYGYGVPFYRESAYRNSSATTCTRAGGGGSARII